MTITIAALQQQVAHEQKLNPPLYTRLDKAAFILAVRTIGQLADGSWTVQSEDGLGTYDVMPGVASCSCADYAKYASSDHHCKHRLAVKLKLALEMDGMKPASIVGWVPPLAVQRTQAPAPRPQPQQRTRAPEPANPFDRYQDDPAAPPPRDAGNGLRHDQVCPDHGAQYLRPSNFGGTFCGGKLGAGWCKWTSKKAAA